MPPPYPSTCDSDPPVPHWNESRLSISGDLDVEPTSAAHASLRQKVGIGVEDSGVEDAIRCLGLERGFQVVSIDPSAGAAATRACDVLVFDALTASRQPGLAGFFAIAAPEPRDFLLIRRRSNTDGEIEAYAYTRAQLGRLHLMLESLFPGDKPPRDAADEILGSAPAIRFVRRQVRRIAKYREVSVMILGETGTGKELVARAIHDLTAAGDPYVALNCAAISEALFESELFGHERGSYTGAHAAHAGLLEQAGVGTVFLDEIGEMPANLQPKLLRALETRSFRRVGGARDIPLRARIVSATNRNLSRQKNDVLRSDLMFRLAGFTVPLPPLRDRLPDLAPLAQKFLRDFSSRHERSRPMGFTSAALTGLGHHLWPGNVRELRAVVEQAAILASGALIEACDVAACLNEWGYAEAPAAATAPGIIAARPADASDARSLDEMQREMVLRTLQRFQGNLTKTAHELGIARSTLRHRLRRYQGS